MQLKVLTLMQKQRASGQDTDVDVECIDGSCIDSISLE